jgi:hypothetical protein
MIREPKRADSAINLRPGIERHRTAIVDRMTDDFSENPAPDPQTIDNAPTINCG